MRLDQVRLSSLPEPALPTFADLEHGEVFVYAHMGQRPLVKLRPAVPGGPDRVAFLKDLAAIADGSAGSDSVSHAGASTQAKRVCRLDITITRVE